MKTTNDFSFKGALQITDNLLILFFELDFMQGDEKKNTSIWLDEKIKCWNKTDHKNGSVATA